MLDLRPTCEHCNRDLPPNAADAMICSFECTFCKPCVDEVLLNVCPNCGGGFCRRPIRPANNLRNNNCLAKYPATLRITHKPVDVRSHQSFAENIKHTPAQDR